MGKTARYLDKRRLEEGYLERWNKDFSLWQRQHSIRLSSTWRRLPSGVLDTHYEAPSKCNDMGLHVQKCSLEDSGPWMQCKCHLLHLRSAGAENAAVSSGHARHKKTLRACHYQCSAAERQQWCWFCYDSNLWNVTKMTELKGSTTHEPVYELDTAVCRLHHDKSNFFHSLPTSTRACCLWPLKPESISDTSHNRNPAQYTDHTIVNEAHIGGHKFGRAKMPLI